MNADEFNKWYKPGCPVIVRKDDGSELQTNTRSIAWKLGHGESVVKVEGIRGCYMLSRVRPMEVHNQPNGGDMSLYNEIKQERIRQDDKWGGPTHDDRHTTMDFIELIESYAAGARQMVDINNQSATRHKLLEIAALAVASIESVDRKQSLL